MRCDHHIFNLRTKMAARMHFLFHITCFAIFTSTIYHNITKIFIQGTTNSYGGRFKFLTFINLIISCIYYGFASMCDGLKIFGLASQPERKKNGKRANEEDTLSKFTAVRDMVFASFIFPFGIIVTAGFWGVMIANPELMLPTRLRHIIPVHGPYNHAAHSLPALLAFMELLLVPHAKYPRKRSGLAFYSLFAALYVSWLFWIAYRANIWVYPVLQAMSLPGVFVFVGSFYLVGGLFFLIGHFINSCLLIPGTAKVE